MKLLIQPGDGADRLLKSIRRAKKSVELLIFRFDLSEVEKALVEVAGRGVFVHALIAFTNHGGEAHLRRLETRLLEKGISVARTAGDLVRYHGKMVLVDRKELSLLAFNFTHLDIDHSRSFGVITRNVGLVREAVRLFDADTKRQPFVSGNSKFVVSPVNARMVLSAFLKGAKEELLIYDPEVSDRSMLRLLLERKNAGVSVRVIGKVNQSRIPVRCLSGLHLHTRTIVRDRQDAFIGSQSLRQLELNSRREIGVIFRNRTVVSSLARVFEDDWEASEPEAEAKARRIPVGRTAKRMAKAVSKSLPVTPVVHQVVKAIQKKATFESRPEIEKTVRAVFKEVVEDSVKDATKKAIKTMVEAPDLEDLRTK